MKTMRAATNMKMITPIHTHYHTPHQRTAIMLMNTEAVTTAIPTAQ